MLGRLKRIYKELRVAREVMNSIEKFGVERTYRSQERHLKTQDIESKYKWKMLQGGH